MTLHDLIKKKPYLVWHTKDFNNLSNEAIVEAVLNYGDFDDVRTLCHLLGTKKVAMIFKKQTKHRRHNYSPPIKHFFQLYFNAYA